MKLINSKTSVELQSALNYFQIKQTKRGKNVLVIEAIKRVLKNFILHETKLLEEGNTIIIKFLEYESPLKQFTAEGGQHVNLKGHIDRIDIFNGVYRIIDYKTGSFQSPEIKCNDLSELDKKPKLLQLLLYAWLFNQKNSNISAPVLSGIINLRALSFDFHPCYINKSSEINKDTMHKFESYLSSLIGQMFNTELER